MTGIPLPEGHASNYQVGMQADDSSSTLGWTCVMSHLDRLGSTGDSLGACQTRRHAITVGVGERRLMESFGN